MLRRRLRWVVAIPAAVATQVCGTLGWEAGYWALAQDTTYATVYDADNYAIDGNMTYGMKNFRRLRHNDGGGWRPVNHYFAYGIPSSDY